MRAKSLTLVLASTLLFTVAASFAAEESAKDKAEDAVPFAQTAIFSVPDLSDTAVVKGLTKALAKEKGIITAKAESKAGKFLVTFETANNTPEALTKVVTRVAPEAKLDAVHEANAKPAAHGDCGKCPSKSSCPKSKKPTT